MKIEFKKLMFLSMVFPLFAAGCMSVEEQRAEDRSRCASYGFESGSTAFADCVMRMDLKREETNFELQRMARERGKTD